MIPNNVMCKRINAVVITLMLFGLVTALCAEENIILTPSQPPPATKTLSFPSGQCMGNLYLEPESGPGWNPEGVCLSYSWTYFSAAQGDVIVPEDRNVQLIVQLAVTPSGSAGLRAQNPLLYRLSIADRTRKDPEELSGLLQLDPNDLFRLTIESAVPRTGGLKSGILEPIRHLTGLQMLKLSGTGITDKDLESLTCLRSLKSLELFQEPRIGTHGIAVLREFPALEYLDLFMGLTDAGLKQLGRCPIYAG